MVISKNKKAEISAFFYDIISLGGIMEEEYYTGYVNGIFNMVSYNMGPSYMEARCFKKKDIKKDIIDYFAIKEKDFDLKREDTSYQELLKNILNISDKELDTLFHFLNIRFGEAKEIYRIENKKVINQIEMEAPFFFLEDCFLIMFAKVYIFIMIGNDE